MYLEMFFISEGNFEEVWPVAGLVSINGTRLWYFETE